jgi:DNA-binding response OmpR family regulator
LLLDVQMPGMTGFELYKGIIRQIDGNAKVCFLTAAFETCRKEFALLFPMLNEVKCFLKKPIAMDDLVKRLGALLEPN